MRDLVIYSCPLPGLHCVLKAACQSNEGPVSRLVIEQIVEDTISGGHHLDVSR